LWTKYCRHHKFARCLNHGYAIRYQPQTANRSDNIEPEEGGVLLLYAIEKALNSSCRGLDGNEQKEIGENGNATITQVAAITFH